MSSHDVPMADAGAGEVLDATLYMSALASDVQKHPAPGSSLASDVQQPAVVATTAPAQEAAPPEPNHHFLDLRGEDAVGSFLAAAEKSAEDAITGEYERRARLLEARCEEAASALQAAEQETSFFRDELAELRFIADKIIPELDCEDLEEQNQRLRAEVDATTKEIEWKMEKIAKLQELNKVKGPTQGAFEDNTLDWAGGESKLADHDLLLHELKKNSPTHTKGSLEINTSGVGGGESKVADHVRTLHENHKQEMKAINSKRIQLERQLEQREKALVLIARELNMKLQAGENLTGEYHVHLYAVMMHVRDILEKEGKTLKDSLLDLFKREQANNKELQENRQELIQGFENMLISGGTVVGIKRMGQLDENPFRAACSLKYRDSDPEGKAARLVSYWQEEIERPSWRPFMTIQVDGEDKEVIDDNDPKLKKLQFEYGDSVCSAVKDGLRELNEYSPRGRHVMNEAWNFREGRKATMKELITCILGQLAVADPGLRGQEIKVRAKKYSTSI